MENERLEIEKRLKTISSETLGVYFSKQISEKYPEEYQKFQQNKEQVRSYSSKATQISDLKERFNKADLIIWLDYSTFSQLKGVFKRIITTFNKERPEIPGCKERLNFTFIKYVATYNRKKRPLLLENLKDISPDKILIFKNQKALNKWLIDFTHNKNILNNIKN